MALPHPRPLDVLRQRIQHGRISPRFRSPSRVTPALSGSISPAPLPQLPRPATLFRRLSHRSASVHVMGTVLPCSRHSRCRLCSRRNRCRNRTRPLHTTLLVSPRARERPLLPTHLRIRPTAMHRQSPRLLLLLLLLRIFPHPHAGFRAVESRRSQGTLTRLISSRLSQKLNTHPSTLLTRCLYPFHLQAWRMLPRRC